MANIADLGWLYGVGTAFDVMGQLQSGRMARIAGERQQVAAEFSAWAREHQAGQVIAIAQRQAMEEQRQGEMQASRALAVAAASGGGVSDPTIMNLLANIKGEAVYRANVALYEGEARARQLRLEALAGRATGAEEVVEGLRQERAYQTSSVGSLIKGGASLYAKYGRGGPDAGSGDEALIED